MNLAKLSLQLDNPLLLFQHQHLAVYLLPDLSAVHVEWLSYPGRQYKECFDGILDAMRRTGSRRILADLRRMGPLEEDIRHWLVDDWLARALAVGYSANAIVVANDVYTQLVVDEILDGFRERNAQLLEAYFDDVAPAKAWLAKMPV